jgi:hypothetical protein
LFDLSGPNLPVLLPIVTSDQFVVEEKEEQMSKLFLFFSFILACSAIFPDEAGIIDW